MKLTNLTKSVLAATALTFASFGANASAISTVDLQISNLAFVFQDSNGNPIDGSAITSTAISFANSYASASLNGGIVGGTRVDQTNGDFDITASTGTGIDTSGTGSFGNVSFNGALNEPGGGSGFTGASASAYGSNFAGSSAGVLNTFNSKFEITTHCAATDTACNNSTINGASIFGWSLDVMMHVFDQGESASYGWAFGYNIKEKGSLGGGHIFNLSSNAIGSNGGLNELDLLQGSTGENYGIKDTFGLEWNKTYTISINQNVSVGATSVPEPTSIALLGLGLLGFAGAARRRKS